VTPKGQVLTPICLEPLEPNISKIISNHWLLHVDSLLWGSTVGYRNGFLFVADVSWTEIKWHWAVSVRLCNSMALVDFVSLSFKHFKMRKNARKCIAVKPILEKFRDRKGALPLPRPPLSTLRKSCPLCPTHFLVPSGAYASSAVLQRDPSSLDACASIAWVVSDSWASSINCRFKILFCVRPIYGSLEWRIASNSCKPTYAS